MNETDTHFKQIVETLSIDDTADRRHKAALREQMLTVYQDAATQNPPHCVWPNWSKIMKSKLTKTAAAAVIFIAAFIVLTQSPTLAWADVVKQIQEFRPYQSRQTVYYENAEPQSQVDMHLSLSQRREERDDGLIYIFDLSACPIRTLVLDDQKQTAKLNVNYSMGPLKDPDILRMLAQMKETDTEVLDCIKMNGIQAQGFRSVDQHNDITIWADIHTGLPVKVEIVHINRGRKIVLDNLQFDVPFDASLFSTEPPSNYKLDETILGKKPSADDETTALDNATTAEITGVAGPEQFVPHSYIEAVYINNKLLVERTVSHKTLSLRREVHFDDDSIHIIDLTEKPVQYIRIDPKNKKAKLNIRYDMGPAKNPDMLAMLAGMRAEGQSERLGLENINGFQTEGFRQVSEYNDITIWADVYTGYPVKIEIVHPNQKIIQQDFDFATELDDSLFTMDVPEGYDLQKEVVGITLDTKEVTQEHVRQTATRPVYVMDHALSWTKEPFIIESTDPSDSKEKVYSSNTVGNDGRHVVIGQSVTFDENLKSKIRSGQGHLCLERKGFTVWNGGPEKWYSKIMLESAEGMIPPGISEDRTGYAVETPDETILVIGINGVLTDDELKELVENLECCTESAMENKPDIDSDGTVSFSKEALEEKLKEIEQSEDKESGMLNLALALSGKKMTPEEKTAALRMLKLNEKDLISGLANYAKLSGGAFPDSLDNKELLPGLEKLAFTEDLTKEEKESMVREVFYAGAFYSKLQREKKEPHYIPGLTFSDSAEVAELLRWKADDGGFRVVYTDLSMKTRTP